MAPLTPRSGAGVGGEFGVGADSDHDEDEIDCARDRLAVLAGGDGERTGVGAGDGGDGGVGEDFDTVAFEFGVHKGAEFGVDGGQNFGQGFDLGDVDAAGGQGFSHLQADVAGTDDHRGGGVALLQGVHDGEGVAHGVQQVHPVGGAERVGAAEPADGWAGTDGAGAHDQGVVGQLLWGAGGVEDVEGVLVDVDAGGAGVGQHPHAGGGQVGGGAMGQVGPVGDFPGDVVGDAADGEVGIGVGDDHGDIGGGVEFAGAQRRADAGITATDGDDMTNGHAGFGS